MDLHIRKVAFVLTKWDLLKGFVNVCVVKFVEVVSFPDHCVPKKVIWWQLELLRFPEDVLP